MRDFIEIKNFLLKLLEEKLPEYFYYHSLEHTKYVLEKVQEIAKYELILDEHDLLLLKIAALYHDVGYIVSNINHEVESCKILQEHQDFLGLDNKDLDVIKRMIMATKIPQNPKNNLECIIADADLEYLGTNDFKRIGDLLFKELKYLDSSLTPQKWLSVQIDFLDNHRYYTAYCLKEKTPIKENNLSQLKGITL